MNKEDVDLIIIKISLYNKEAICFRIYRDGQIYRKGNGMLPSLKLGCLSYTNDPICFNFIMNDAPDEIFKEPINYVEPNPNGSLEYFMGFYGVENKNYNDENEESERTLVTGLRFLLDNKTTFQNDALSLIDGLSIELLKMTKRWYFDVYMKYVYNATSTNFPKKNSFIGPTDKDAINKDYENFIHQILIGKRGINLKDILKNKEYILEGNICKAFLNENNQIKFIPVAN